MTEENKPCPFCGGTDIYIEAGGQIWGGVKGWSKPQYFRLYHDGKLDTDGEFQTCHVQFRAWSAPAVYALWQGEDE